MKNIIIFLLLSLSFSHSSSDWMRVYDMEGSEVKLENNTTHLIICYTPACCHECMNELLLFCRNMISNRENYKCSILISGDDFMRMHIETSYLEEYLSGTSDVSIVYDSNPIKKERVFYRYRKKIQHSPSLLVIDSTRRYHFFSYESLFESKQGFNKIIKYLK